MNGAPYLISLERNHRRKHKFKWKSVSFVPKVNFLYQFHAVSNLLARSLFIPIISIIFSFLEFQDNDWKLSDVGSDRNEGRFTRWTAFYSKELFQQKSFFATKAFFGGNPQMKLQNMPISFDGDVINRCPQKSLSIATCGNDSCAMTPI